MINVYQLHRQDGETLNLKATDDASALREARALSLPNFGGKVFHYDDAHPFAGRLVEQFGHTPSAAAGSGR